MEYPKEKSDGLKYKNENIDGAFTPLYQLNNPNVYKHLG